MQLQFARHGKERRSARGRAHVAAVPVTVVLAVFLGCGGNSKPSAGDKPLVLCTTTMIADMVGRIGGDRVRVIGIMPPGTDPHIYEPKPDDSVLMQKAALILYNGLHLEGKMVAMFERAGAKGVALAEDPRIKTRGSESNQGAPDPHCWWNARYFMIYTERARDALIGIDPQGADGYRERAARYLAELEDLDGRIRAAIERIPPERRYLITSHDAFYYYGLAYGLKVDGVLGISTEASVRALRVDELVRLVVERRIPAVFHETSVSASLNEIVTRVVDLAGRQGHPVVIPEQALYSDSLDKPGTPAGTYLGALRENTRIIVSALADEDVSELLQPDKDAGGGDHRHKAAPK